MGCVLWLGETAHKRTHYYCYYDYDYYDYYKRQMTDNTLHQPVSVNESLVGVTQSVNIWCTYGSMYNSVGPHSSPPHQPQLSISLIEEIIITIIILNKIIITIIVISIRAFISIFPNQFKAPQGRARCLPTARARRTLGLTNGWVSNLRIWADFR